MYRLLPLLLLWLALPGFSIAQDLRADTIDIRQYRLNLNFSDFAGKNMAGEAVIKVFGKKDNLNSIRLDLQQLTVDSVKFNGTNAGFSYNDTIIGITFNSALNIGDSAELRIFYHGKPIQVAGDFGGFYWTNQYAFNIGVSFLADPHSYGRVWFPCFDDFVTRSFYEFSITTDNTRKAVCNGLLLNTTANPNSTQTWYWRLNQPIPSYLASVTISDYQLLNDTVVGLNGTLPVTLAARAPDTTALKNSFVHLKDAFHIYEDLFGPYQFDRVGYCVVPFNAGAMEHATNISYMQALVNGNTAYETTMAHELSHHWFGDLATCENASEMWLNEGWAVYSEHLFLEKLYNDSTAKDAIRKNHESVLRTAHIDDGAYYAVSGVPSEQTYGRTVYDKGADVAHTLRGYMPDSTFFTCLKNYFTQYSFKDVNSQKFRDFLSQCSGTDYTNAFNDWVFQPGFLHFSLAGVNVEEASPGNFRAQLSIRQKLNHANHLGNNVPVTISYFNENWQRIDETILVSGACTSCERSFAGFKPVYIALDFNEQLQDAITDEWRVVKNNSTIDFGTAKAKLTFNSVNDSALVRIEHNWVAADAMQTSIPGLHLHNYRYWTIDGLFDSTTLSADARFDYNGTNNQNNGYLDNSFITTSEDSLVVMYRKDGNAEWAYADSFKIFTLGPANNKVGYAMVYGIRKGQYALAIRNTQQPDTAVAQAPCIYSSIGGTGQVLKPFRVYPNPSYSNVQLEFTGNTFKAWQLADLSGRILKAGSIESSDTAAMLTVDDVASGIYFISLQTHSNRFITQKIVKE